MPKGGLVSEETNNDLSDTNEFSDGSDRVQLVMEENEKTGSEQKPSRLKTFVRSCKGKSRCRRNSWKVGSSWCAGVCSSNDDFIRDYSNLK